MDLLPHTDLMPLAVSHTVFQDRKAMHKSRGEYILHSCVGWVCIHSISLGISRIQLFDLLDCM